MNTQQNFPQVAGPVLAANGSFTEEIWAFVRTLWNRTGQAPGVSSEDLSILATAAALSRGAQGDPGAQALAQSAFLSAARALKGSGADYTQARAFALMISGARKPTFWAQATGSPLTSELDTLNFTGGGVTASLTSAGVVQVNVPVGAGGVTSITAGTGLAATPNPIVGTGTISLANTAVTPGTYGDGSHTLTLTVNAQGQLTAVSANAISSGGSWFPLTNGVEPPAFVSDGAGVPIAVAYNP